jgi:type I restriction enzyme S subunit
LQLVEFGTVMNMTKGKKPKNISKEEREGYLPYVDIQAFEKNIFDNYTDGFKLYPLSRTF